jgi:DNA-binding PadR family transcriptional regulator
MFSPKKDMRELILEVLKKDPTSISGVSRELETRGVKLHRLELTGYLKALAEMGVLRERDIKPAKVFSISPLHGRSFHELLGEACNAIASDPDERATLAAFCLQTLFKRAVFDMEVKRCGMDGVVRGRKATPEERSEARLFLTRQGYKVPNNDTPTIVEEELAEGFARALSYIVVERYSLGQHVKETTQTKL